MVNTGYVSLTTAALAGTVYIQRVHLERHLLGPLGFGILRSLFVWPYLLRYCLRQNCAREKNDVQATKTVANNIYLYTYAKRPHSQ